MPLYDFRCQSCGEFDALRSLSDLERPMPCPTCEEPAQRLVTAPNISLSSSKLRALDRRVSEPRVVTCDRSARSQSSSQTKVQNIRSSRPWMISHTPQRL